MLLDRSDRVAALFKSTIGLVRMLLEGEAQDWPLRLRRVVADQQRVFEAMSLVVSVVEAVSKGRSAMPFPGHGERKLAMGEVIERLAMFAGKVGGTSVLPVVDWPGLERLRLSDADLKARMGAIGGSDANIILSGDPDRIVALWREKRGEQDSPDLSTNLAVMLGCWTEAFNRQWYQRISGERVDQVEGALVCPANAWRRCTLDGYLADRGAIWEAKHTSAFAKSEDLLTRYMPQLQHNMAVARCDRAILSVIFGNHKYEIFEIASDWVYQIELLQAEIDFWNCVETGRTPVPAPIPLAPKPVGIREICLDGNNAWASAAADWIEHREAAKRHAAAISQIKDLVEPDVTRAFGHGIEAKRSKAGAISIKELTP